MQMRFLKFEYQGAKTAINVEYIVAVQAVKGDPTINCTIVTEMHSFPTQETYDSVMAGIKAAVNL